MHHADADSDATKRYGVHVTQTLAGHELIGAFLAFLSRAFLPARFLPVLSSKDLCVCICLVSTACMWCSDLSTLYRIV